MSLESVASHITAIQSRSRRGLTPILLRVKPDFSVKGIRIIFPVDSRYAPYSFVKLDKNRILSVFRDDIYMYILYLTGKPEYYSFINVSKDVLSRARRLEKLSIVKRYCISGGELGRIETIDWEDVCIVNGEARYDFTVKEEEITIWEQKQRKDVVEKALEKLYYKSLSDILPKNLKELVYFMVEEYLTSNNYKAVIEYLAKQYDAEVVILKRFAPFRREYVSLEINLPDKTSYGIIAGETEIYYAYDDSEQVEAEGYFIRIEGYGQGLENSIVYGLRFKDRESFLRAVEELKEAKKQLRRLVLGKFLEYISRLLMKGYTTVVHYNNRVLMLLNIGGSSENIYKLSKDVIGEDLPVSVVETVAEKTGVKIKVVNIYEYILDKELPQYADGFIMIRSGLLHGVYPVKKSKYNDKQYYFSRAWRKALLILPLEVDPSGVLVVLDKASGYKVYKYRVVKETAKYIIVEPVEEQGDRG